MTLEDETNMSLLAKFFAAVQSLTLCDAENLIGERGIVEEIRAEILQRFDKLQENLDVSDKIITERNRLLDALLCPVHGQCVPHALEQIAKLQKQNQVYREALEFYKEAGPMEMAQDCAFEKVDGYTIAKPGKRARQALAEGE